MRIKSFTLMEVMIASYVFMVVIVMVVSSFAMINKSNENSDDARVTSTCSRQVEDVLKSAVKSANFGSPMIKGVVFNASSNTYVLSSAATDLVGFATFEDPQVADISMVKIKTFVKKAETVNSFSIYSYYYSTEAISIKTASTPNADPRIDIPDGFDITSTVNSVNSQRINSADCSAADVAQSLIKVSRISAFGSRSTAFIHSLEVRDKFFRAFSDRSTESRYSDINLFVGSDAKNF